MDMQSYHDAVWSEVEEHGGPMESVGRQANADLIEALRTNGLNPSQTALVVIELVTRTHQTLQRCFPVFDDLRKTVKLMGQLVDDETRPVEAMTRMLEAKLEMARIYNFISMIGPGADVSNLPSIAETEAMIEESEQELSQWFEQVNAAMAGNDEA